MPLVTIFFFAAPLNFTSAISRPSDIVSLSLMPLFQPVSFIFLLRFIRHASFLSLMRAFTLYLDRRQLAELCAGGSECVRITQAQQRRYRIRHARQPAGVLPVTAFPAGSKRYRSTRFMRSSRLW